MSAELLSSVDAFVAELASFEPRLYDPEKCVVVVEELARLEKACAAARARTAARAAECGAHRRKGFTKPSDWLARNGIVDRRGGARARHREAPR